MIQAEVQKKPKNYGDVAIDTFVVGFIVMFGKAAWWILLRPLIWIPLALVGGFVYLVGPYGSGFVLAIFMFLMHCWKTLYPSTYTRLIGYPIKMKWRKFWVYEVKGQWRATMVDVGMLKTVKLRRDRWPKIIKVEHNQWRDRVLVELVRGQVVEDMEKIAPRLRPHFDAIEVRVKEGEGRKIQLIIRYADPLVETIPALPIKEDVDIEAVQLGITDEGEEWTIPVVHQQGSHMLVAAASGGGKSGVPWSLIRALCPLIRDGLVQVWVADPKGGVEFKRGTSKDGTRSLWHRYADDFDSITTMLKDLVAEMDARGKRQADSGRMHEMSVEEPIILVPLDEILSVTALETSTRKAATNSLLGKVLTKGRALGIIMMVLSQDARKEMLATRSFYRLRWAGRLDEPNQADMVLGEGARDQGARCDDKKVIPDSLPGVGFVRVDGVREPVRVRVAYVTENDIAEMVRDYAPAKKPDQVREILEKRDHELGIDRITHTSETLAEVEAIMKFYEDQVIAATISSDTGGSTDEFEVVEA